VGWLSSFWYQLPADTCEECIRTPRVLYRLAADTFSKMNQTWRIQMMLQFAH
jgi:hypothetical protein